MCRANSFSDPSVYVWVTLLVLCVGSSPSALAQAPLQADIPVSAHPTGAANESPEAVLGAARALLEKARFDLAKQRTQRLLGRDDLDARTRNAALELSAIIDTAARRERAAQATLTELYARDPWHPRRVHDPGPAVETAFAKARAREQAPAQAVFSALPRRKDDGTLQLRIRLHQGSDAVQSMHVRVWLPGEVEPVDVSRVLGLRDQLTVSLPAPLSFVGVMPVVVEARSPGGFVLGQIGSSEAPASLQVPALPAASLAETLPCPAPPPPIRRVWWLWTSLTVVVTGIILSAGYIAQ